MKARYRVALIEHGTHGNEIVWWYGGDSFPARGDVIDVHIGGTTDGIAPHHVRATVVAIDHESATPIIAKIT